MAVGDYRKIRQIGSGSFGSAHLVHRTGDGASGPPLVLKEVDLSNRDALHRAAAEVEVKVLSSLKHPYIVRYHESFFRDSVLSIVMDFCEAGDLNQHVARQRSRKADASQAQVLRWLTQLFLALKYVHEKKILHRDIKSQNIFLTRCEGCDLLDLRIADFGIAKVLKDQSFAKTRIGTPYYLSPEILRSMPYSCPSDIWASGVVLYEMCTLRLPFEGENMEELVDKILRGRLPRIPESFPDALVEIGTDVLQRTAARRPSAKALLERPLLQAEMEKLQAGMEKLRASQQERERLRSRSGSDEKMQEAPGNFHDLLVGGRPPARPLVGRSKSFTAGRMGSFKDKAPPPLQDEVLRVLLHEAPTALLRDASCGSGLARKFVQPLGSCESQCRWPPSEPIQAVITPPSRPGGRTPISRTPSPAGPRARSAVGSRPTSRKHAGQELLGPRAAGCLIARQRSSSHSSVGAVCEGII